MTTSRVFFGLLITLTGLVAVVHNYFPGALTESREGWEGFLYIACLSYGLALLTTRRG